MRRSSLIPSLSSCVAATLAVVATISVSGCPQEKTEPATNESGSSAPPREARQMLPLQKAVAPAAAAPASPVLGKPAPAFTLKDLDGKDVSLKDYAGKTVVLEWFNPECPFVKASHGVGSLKTFAKEAQEKGVVWLAINSGAEGKQGHAVDVNKAQAASWGLTHPILRDVDGVVGHQYGATNTPHMFVVNGEGVVVYAGAIDNSPDGEGQSPTGGTLVNHVAAALDDLAAGKPVQTASTKAYGCSVKYQ